MVSRLFKTVPEQEIERALGGGRAIDVVLKDGTFIELKNYDWSKYSPGQIASIIEDFLDQLRIYLDHADIVEFVFKGGVPDFVRQELVDAGAIVRVVE